MTNSKETLIVAGIDIGSLTTKSVIMDGNRNILSSEVIQRGLFVDEEAARDCMQTAIEKARVTKKDIAFTVSTGYGRNLSGFGDKNVTEISCHARGAYFLHPEARTIIDIGGQDSKVIVLSENGIVDNFVMNDKCAAGTGRFIEVMSKALGVPLQEAGEFSLRSQSPAKVSSTCVVFAESEVISLRANGIRSMDILAGIHQGIAERLNGMIKTVGIRPEVFMSGGVAKNAGMVYAIEKVIGHKMYLAEEPQIVGAIGAALYALDNALQNA